MLSCSSRRRCVGRCERPRRNLVAPVARSWSRVGQHRSRMIRNTWRRTPAGVYSAIMQPRGLYRIQTVARLTGFSQAVLRVWETRHGLLRPQRSPGGQRLYTDDDLRLLRRVRALLDQGRTIGEVALLGREDLLRDSPPVRPPPEASATEGPHDERLGELCVGLVRAAVELDAPALEHLLDETFSTLSSPIAICRVVEPAAYQIGDLWAAGHCSVAGEHLATLAFRRRLHGLAE